MTIKPRRMLMVVDPQIDFITGSLPVAGAEKAMTNLGHFIADNDGEYAAKIITADRHPFNHCSFTAVGGPWPRHCVHDTVGAAIWPAVFESIYSTAGLSALFPKGTLDNREEYSIFQNPDSSEAIDQIILREQIREIDICGLAGDICVLSTLRDATKRYPSISFRVLKAYSPSLDGGTALREFCTAARIRCE